MENRATNSDQTTSKIRQLKAVYHCTRMQIDNIEETNEDRTTMETNSYVEDDEESRSTWSVNYENQGQNALDIISSAQGEIDYSGSLVGITRDTVEEIYDLYKRHSLSVGFSVRKSNMRTNVAGFLVYRLLVCACQGLKNAKEYAEKKRYRHNTRTECKAYLKIHYNVDAGVYEVTDHFLDHNHPLSRPELSYLHRSNREISNENAIRIEDMVSSGIKPTDAYRYIAKEAGGEDMLGYTEKDQHNFLSRLKILAIEGGDAQTVMDTLEEESAEQNDFFYRVRLDDEGRLSHMFWRDSMMKDDYVIFGDVMVFDTTYRTNKYNLICAPFVGVNNHHKNVMFGCAFLSNETVETFVWLFETFKKSMGGRAPISLFTDQDLAMTKAIEKVFPQTRHRLCIWHLQENAQKHLSKKLKSDKEFVNAFQKCVTGCKNGDEFEECWKKMITQFQLEQHSWMERLYQFREKWSNAFNKDYFSAGILSSQRSESTNKALSFKSKKTTSLTDFYELFKQTVKRWRNNELNDEFQCSRAEPSSSLPMTGMIKQAAQVYTFAIFKDFEKQFYKCLSHPFLLLSDASDFKVYEVKDFENTYQVSLHVVDHMVSCNCKMFEESGILCSHCLRILHSNSINQIPDCYIHKRWTKIAKQALWDKSFEQEKRGVRNWRHDMMRECLNVILQVQENDKAKTIFEDGFKATKSAALTELNCTSLERNEIEEDVGSSGSTLVVKDPKKAVTKGRKKERIKGQIEKNRKRRKKRSAEANAVSTNEFGSKTPNPHLF